MTRCTPKKAAALSALAESNSFTEAAKKAGIDRKTLYSYIRNDLDFAIAYRNQQEESTLLCMDYLIQRREKAIEVLVKIMEDEKKPAMARVKAAQTILNASMTQSKIVSTIAVENVDAVKDSDPFGNLSFI